MMIFKAQNRKYAALLHNVRCFIFLLITIAGCATRPIPPSTSMRPFSFANDTFTFPNELKWEYYFDEQGQWKNRRHEPSPTYSLHCFVVAHSVQQFFEHAQFDDSRLVASEETYRQLVHEIVTRKAGQRSNASDKIAIPGYKNLREFSAAHENLLKDECGGAWRCYFQRGNWRMVFPFSGRHQEKMAQQLVDSVKQKRPAVAHVVCFPQLTINHAVLLFDVAEDEKKIVFSIYDPNYTDHPSMLIYDRAKREFSLPSNTYFPGGKVDVYEIYRSALY